MADPSPTTFSAGSYFATQSPPLTLEEDVSSVRSFLERQVMAERKVVLVTVSKCFLR